MTSMSSMPSSWTSKHKSSRFYIIKYRTLRKLKIHEKDTVHVSENIPFAPVLSAKSTKSIAKNYII